MKILIQIAKIASISLLFALIFNFTNAYFNDSIENNSTLSSKNTEIEDNSETLNNNKYNFKKSNSIILSNIGVALTTNIGIKYKQRSEQNLYQDLPKIAQTISNNKFSDNTNLSRHILKISEYYNVLRTDINQMINSSYNKKMTLEAYIEQLKFRYKGSILEMQSLVKKKAELSSDLDTSSNKINLIKIKIDKDFKNFDAYQTEQNIKILLEERAKYDYARTHIIFMNQYIKQYYALNNSNKKLLDTLINNKNAIIKNTKIVIPDTGIEGLRKLNLIVDEKDYKTK